MSALKEKVVLITGAGRGSGRRLAGMFATRGSQVAVADVTPVNLDETVAGILAAGGVVKAYIADIARKLPIQGLLNQVLDDFGRLDILVNCAEVEPQKTVLEMDEWDWVRTLDVNLSGAFLLTQSVGRIMREKGGGVIVHLGERAKGAERRAAYFTSKAGLASLVKSAAQEFSEYGIKVRLFGTQELEAILDFCEQQEDKMTGLESLFGALRAAPHEINRILAENPLPGLQAVRSDGEWNAHQVLVHLRDVNREVYFPRLEQIINQVNPSFPEWDGERWMQEHYDPAEPLDTLLEEFKRQCEGTAGWLESLPTECLAAPGNPCLPGHPFLPMVGRPDGCSHY